jgi:hypothetical protein
MRVHPAFLGGVLISAASVFAQGPFVSTPYDESKTLIRATVSLYSQAASAQVAPGAPVLWQVRASVPTSQNSGLAGIACDLVQSGTNAAFFDVSPASLPLTGTPMSDFSRPRGISNPLPGNPAASAFGGTPAGPPGARNLVQIGGM